MKRGVKKIIFMSVAIATFCSLAAFSGKGNYHCMSGVHHGHGCIENQSLMKENKCNTKDADIGSQLINLYKALIQQTN